ncbi:MAG: DUF4249 family protein [Bacteroidota bacterium]
MKYPIVLTLCSLFLFYSCDNELELTADWQNIPIVYGILAEDENVQYIRVEKAFLDPETNALTLAQNPDSIYYQNASVQLERPATNETILLERVEGTKEGFPRDPGVFVNDPNFLYKLDLSNSDPLVGGERVLLRIVDERDNILASSETRIVEGFSIVNGQPGDPLTLDEYDRPVRISWRPQGEVAAIYDVRMTIYYEESLPTDASTFVDKSLTWVIAKNLLRDNDDRMGIQFSGEDFYRFMDGAIEPAPNQIRRFRDLDVTISAAGGELAQYIRVRQANTGITSSQVVPTFSNVEGGLGLFSSSAEVSKTGIRITPGSLDSLAQGFYTRDLSFE